MDLFDGFEIEGLGLVGCLALVAFVALCVLVLAACAVLWLGIDVATYVG